MQLVIKTILPDDAWDCINIDGRDCQGCFFRQVETLDREKERLICWIIIPRCRCPDCRVFCESIVNPYDGSLYKVSRPGKTAEQGCDKWFLDLVCDDCD